MSEAATPAIGYSVTANLGGDRQIVFQHFVGQDQADADVNKSLDRIMGFVDRLQARGELPGLRDELETHEKTLARYTADKKAVAEQFDRDQAMADLQISTLRKKLETTTNDAVAAHRANGRQGDYRAIGQTKASLDRIQNEIGAVEEAKGKALAERDLAVQNLAVTETRYAEEIEKIKAKIAEREAKLKDT